MENFNLSDTEVTGARLRYRWEKEVPVNCSTLWPGLRTEERQFYNNPCPRTTFFHGFTETSGPEPHVDTAPDRREIRVTKTKELIQSQAVSFLSVEVIESGGHKPISPLNGKNFVWQYIKILYERKRRHWCHKFFMLNFKRSYITESFKNVSQNQHVIIYVIIRQY